MDQSIKERYMSINHKINQPFKTDFYGASNYSLNEKITTLRLYELNEITCYSLKDVNC